MSAISIENHPKGLRVRIAGQRIHHGALGAVLLTRPQLAFKTIGALLMIHDRADWRAWFAPGAQLAD